MIKKIKKLKPAKPSIAKIDWDSEDYDSTVTPLPKLSNWEAYLFGDHGGIGLTWRPNRGDVPNRFHRIMQRLILGIYWHKYDK